VQELNVEERTYAAFAGDRLVVGADVETVLRRVKAGLDRGEFEQVLIFDDATGKEVDFDLRGTADDVVARLAHHPMFAPEGVPAATRTGPGRPKLGVVSREVSLLPRHWEWLEEQPNGISAALRRLVDEARKAGAGPDTIRRATEAAGRFMTTMAGNLPGFEEASRALYAHDGERFEQCIRDWPKDIRDHARCMAAGSFPEGVGNDLRN
jgi:uncharacterized protein